MLTPKREAFVVGLAKGLSQAAAYRIAFPTSLKWKDSSVWEKASVLAADVNVQSRLTELQAKAAAANEVTLANHVATLADLRDEARQAWQFGAAIQAEAARGKASGLYRERVELTGKNGGPIEATARPLAELSIEEIRAGLALLGKP